MRSSTAGVALLVFLAGLPLAACKKAAGPEAPAEAAMSKAPAAPAADGSAKPAAPAPSGPMLAYSYHFTIEAPPDGITALSRRQEQACVAAGPQLCQVVGSNVSRQDGEVSGSLKLRAVASWVTAFRSRLDQDVQAAGGKLSGQEVSSEDLARSIVDTGAELRAKIMLRDRLEKLLAERPGKLAELLQLEKSIAEVQGEIDTAQSELAAMQGQVQMSDLTLEYHSRGAVVGGRAAGQLGRAFGGFLGNAATVSALLVTLIADLLPLLVLGALGWAVVGWIRRRRPGPPQARPG